MKKSSEIVLYLTIIPACHPRGNRRCRLRSPVSRLRSRCGDEKRLAGNTKTRCQNPWLVRPCGTNAAGNRFTLTPPGFPDGHPDSPGGARQPEGVAGRQPAALLLGMRRGADRLRRRNGPAVDACQGVVSRRDGSPPPCLSGGRLNRPEQSIFRMCGVRPARASPSIAVRPVPRSSRHGFAEPSPSRSRAATWRRSAPSSFLWISPPEPGV